jgi:transcriptional regulator with XRE-family HTH domain
MTLRMSDVLAQWRWATRCDLNVLAADIGISASTLSRFEKGENPSGDTMAKIMRWLLVDLPKMPAKPGHLMLEDRREDHAGADRRSVPGGDAGPGD